MVEAIQCPSCQTRYGLRPARVRSGIRRAQCLRCGDVFHVEMEVKRLLAAMDSPASTANVPVSSFAEAIAPHQQPTPTLEANELALGDLELSEESPGDEAWPDPSQTAPIPSMARAPEPEPETAPAPEEMTMSGGYASAKDAIAKLFGDTPLAPSPTASLRNALDTEAGMKALDDTLGGLNPSLLKTQPFAEPTEPATPSAPSIAEAMTAEEFPHASATLRMTASEMVSAMGSVKTSAALEMPEISQDEVTMVLPPPPPSAPMEADPSALRLRIGDQVYQGLDLPTIAKWIEEGRVLEEHQVARGTSDVWMDASKVPALRAVFERLRRARLGISNELPPPPSSPDTSQLKRGLFGGMFGKKD